MNKPIILHICLSSGWGGLEMYPIRIGSELLKKDYKTYGLCIKGSQVAHGFTAAGIEIFEVESKSSLIFTQLLTLNRWLKKRGINTIHCHKSGDILISALLHRMTPRHSFFTEHMGVTRSKKDLYHRWCYSHLQRVFSISGETYHRNLKALPLDKSKITKLWLGTDIPPQHLYKQHEIDNIKIELGLPLDSLIIGNIGRICEGKGQHTLLEAFALIQHKYPDTHLLLVGGFDASEGSDRHFVDSLRSRISELKLEKLVHLTGFRKDTVRVLSVIDIVCLPNRNEAFGLTAIEAMAATKAIVAANTGALPEILEPVALLANPCNPTDIANKIELFLSNLELRIQKSEAAFDRASLEFSMEKHIEKLLSFYKE